MGAVTADWVGSVDDTDDVMVTVTLDGALYAIKCGVSRVFLKF